jgi:hypothetical protein
MTVVSESTVGVRSDGGGSKSTLANAVLTAQLIFCGMESVARIHAGAAALVNDDEHPVHVRKVTVSSAVEHCTAHREPLTYRYHLLDGVHLPVESALLVIHYSLRTEFLTIRNLVH